MVLKQAAVQVTRWHGSQHPSIANIIQRMKEDGLRPYMWMNMANHRYGIRSHGYDKVLYVIDGTLEIVFPDLNERVILRAGDRVDIPAGVRHSTIVGKSGAKCAEAALRANARARR